ncbi:putative bifunctional diguanylate cyclase/phosphodiesterase [Amphritea sp. HPY]|uniref:putative bifunctional diguanylate cyclase/phosphodiesterase n=1 Tax=Amphritea sp. HPY TaxID=3421652 RepID=UPI003D7E88FF
MKKLFPAFVRDLVIMMSGIVILSLTLSEYDAFELLFEFTRTHEEWEMDEIIVSVLISPLFLSWFAYRRWRETLRAVKKRKNREHELIQIQDTLSHRATHDILTGLPNRILLTDRLRQGMMQVKRNKQQLAVIYVDLDDFKSINDQYGHEVGDQLLITLSSLMEQILREGDTIARFGGDEFIGVLTGLDNTQCSIPILKRLLDAIAQPVHISGQVIQASASFGVTYYPQEEVVDADQLLRQVDQALYQAKLEGKNQYCLFNIDKDRNARGDHERLEGIREALIAKEFVLYYQPKVNMRTGEITGAEALIRWQHPERGLIPPADFLPLIENHPLAIDIGEWVITTALTQMKTWQDAGLDIPVSVNVSAFELMQADFVERLQALLNTTPDVDPGCLLLEVLETSALEDIAYVEQVIRDCQEIGVEFALDDFGTGYSSLTYLKRLSAAQLKIDRSFVRDMLDSPDDLAILKGIVGMATAFNRQVIAEGVETVEHGKLLLLLGCELAQGFGIGRPMPAADIQAWVDNWRPDLSWVNQPVAEHNDLPALMDGIEHRVHSQRLHEVS